MFKKKHGYFHFSDSVLSFAVSSITELQPDAASFYANFFTFPHALEFEPSSLPSRTERKRADWAVLHVNRLFPLATKNRLVEPIRSLTKHHCSVTEMATTEVGKKNLILYFSPYKNDVCTSLQQSVGLRWTCTIFRCGFSTFANFNGYCS